MGKKLRFVDKSGNQISAGALRRASSMFFARPDSREQSYDEPPKDLGEFEDRLGVFLEQLRRLFFGLTYDVEATKTLKRNKSTEVLVEALCNYEKNLKGKLKNEYLETVPFLKLVLERDASLFGKDRYLLGVERDRSGISLPQKNVIAVQCAAQVLWHMEGSKLPTIKAMEKRLLNRSDPWFKLLSLKRFTRDRTIARWVSEVFPVPKGSRKGRPSEKTSADKAFKRLITIPGIFLSKTERINFLKLRFALVCLTHILKSLDWELESIWESKYIRHYVRSLKFYPVLYAKDWVCEAFAENSSIFSP